MKFVCDLPDVLPEVWAEVPRSRIGVLDFYPPQKRHNEIAEKKGGGDSDALSIPLVHPLEHGPSD